jgi:hypothetical protein
MIAHDLGCTVIRKRRTRWRIDIAMKITGYPSEIVCRGYAIVDECVTREGV